MISNKERQRILDQEKWIESEKEKDDLSGSMKYCEFCNENIPGSVYCRIGQADREEGCLCAKAYNRMIFNSKK